MTSPEASWASYEKPIDSLVFSSADTGAADPCQYSRRFLRRRRLDSGSSRCLPRWHLARNGFGQWPYHRGVIDEAGDSDFMRADNAVFIGKVSTSGNSISAAVDGYAGANLFPDGSTHGTWTIDGTIRERESISVTTKFTTDAGTVTQGTLDLTFDALYDRQSSLATVAGRFTDTGFDISVEADGSFGESVLLCGGVAGHIALIDTTHNVYRVQSGNSCGTSSNGLAMLDNTSSPERLVTGFLVTSNGLASGFVDTWRRQN